MEWPTPACIESDSFNDEPEDEGEAEYCSRNCLHKTKAGELDRNFCPMCKNSTFVCGEVGDYAKEPPGIWLAQWLPKGIPRELCTVPTCPAQEPQQGP